MARLRSAFSCILAGARALVDAPRWVEFVQFFQVTRGVKDSPQF